MFLTDLNAEIVACTLFIQKIASQAESGNALPNMVFPPIWGGTMAAF